MNTDEIKHGFDITFLWSVELYDGLIYPHEDAADVEEKFSAQTSRNMFYQLEMPERLGKEVLDNYDKAYEFLASIRISFRERKEARIDICKIVRFFL